MSTTAEIKRAIEHLKPEERVALMGWLQAEELESDPTELERALAAGLRDADANRVKSVEDVRALIPGWISKPS
jgi:predicted transcriptional regulator